MSFNKTIINIKQFFSEYRYNLIVSLLLASLVQKVLFGRIKVEPLIFLFLFFCLLSLKKYSCYCLLIIAFVFSAMIPSAILVKTGLLTQDFLSLIVTISNEEIWFYIKSTPIQFILIASVYFALITWLVIRSRTVASHKVMGYFFILSILFAYPFYNRNHLNKIYHDWSVWKNLSSKPHKKPSWYVTKKQKAECEIYVIVLGESLRVDALSLYGNPIETTPFLKSIPTKYITHYIGTAPGTNPSIPRIFALSDSTDLNINHVENNIINIGKEAGLETFWISSQGYVGKHEVGASSIATSADHIIVTNDIKEDFSLLPLIQSSLNSNDKRKLLIVHLWGQHEAPWKHLDGIGVVFNTGKGKFIDSYFSSIKKTDVFLQRMTDMIRSTGKKFKVVFFPDHALNFIQDGDGYIQYRDADIKQTYEIPFIAFGSDIKTTERINITQSAYNFTSYFPTWIGVETNLTPKGFDIFTESCTSPKIVKYGEIPASFSSLKDGLKIKDILQAW